MTHRHTQLMVVIPAAVLLLTSAGCRRALQPELPETLHQSLVESVRREVEALPDDPALSETTQPPDTISETLAQRMDELDQLAGPGSYSDLELAAEEDLTGSPQREIGVSLDEAILTAVENNLAVQIAAIQPAISEADLVAAQAAFDAVFFLNLTHTITDEPSTVPVLGGVPLGTPVSVNDNTELETGIRQPLDTGGTITVSTRLTRSENESPGFALSPDPAYFARLSLGIEQPLLRGFGQTVNRSQIYFAENASRRAREAYRASLLDIVERAEAAYWELVAARHELLIQQRLLERGIEVRDRIDRRRIREASDAQYADAVATVEQRRANVIRAIRRVRRASDTLKVIINDPEVSVGSEMLLKPTDVMVDTPIEYNVRDAIVTAVERRPEVHQAVLDLNDRAIAVSVAENATLPLLNVSARMETIGLDDDAPTSYEESFDDQFINYFLSALFEYPIGNRAADAAARRARLEQTTTLLAYRQTVQDVVFDVKTALRDVVTNYQLILATRTTRLAQAENLRALVAEQERGLEGLDALQLNLRFQRQDGLANAEIQEIEALANYNVAVARLYRAMGVGLDVHGIDIADPDEAD